MTKTFNIEAEVTLRGTISIEANSLAEAQQRVDDGDITMIDEHFYATAGISDWDFQDPVRA